MKFGVVRFPGSCDEVDALLAASRVGEAELLWHGDRDLRRRRRRRPRRLLLRRLPARGRDRALLAGDGVGDRVRARGRARARDLQRLPGAVRGRPAAGRAAAERALRFVCRQVDLEVVDADTPFTSAATRGERLSIPVKHTTGRYYPPPDAAADRGRPQVVLRYAPGQNPNGSLRDVAGVAQRGGQRVRPHAPPRARRRRADRLGRRAGQLSSRWRASPPRACRWRFPASTRRRARPHRRRVRADRREARPRAQRGRAGDVLADVVRALRLQALAQAAARLPTEGPHVLMGPGENAGAVDVGGGLACAFKVESHNHPSAVEPFQGAATGVGGILRDVFAVGARPIAVLDSLRFGEPTPSARATCSTAPSPASATTATRSACRRSAARSTSRRPTSPTAWSTRCASAWPSTSG